MSADEPPHPDAGRGETPTKRTETVRDDPDERVCVEWFEDTPTPSFVRVSCGDETMLSLDRNEVEQAATAARAACDGGEELVRNMGALERVWFESDDGFVTLVVEGAGDLERMIVFDRDEAARLAELLEAVDQAIPPVEDEPYV